jgi:CBS domain-containing protein
MRAYHPLQQHALATGGECVLARPVAPRATLDSPALEVMTDLSRIPAVSIDGSASISAANDYMIARGVRSLFVLHGAMVAGLLTASDVLGERAVRIGHARGVKRHELLVSDVMTPLADVVAFAWRDVASAKVGHVIASMREMGHHHALVAEPTTKGGQCIRGIFSASEIARQLGEPVQIAEIATTFAQVEQVLAPHR